MKQTNMVNKLPGTPHTNNFYPMIVEYLKKKSKMVSNKDINISLVVAMLT